MVSKSERSFRLSSPEVAALALREHNFRDVMQISPQRRKPADPYRFTPQRHRYRPQMNMENPQPRSRLHDALADRRPAFATRLGLVKGRAG
ncbi:hypothetical protein HBH56_080670 [Parastagonospora nodorum]|nr:hypothetical protein HBH56_080670 [Parastagonospora nodorum]KAH3929704.1 hypothetical protein HBH54_121150 [Parastagonospora nodorum]KAH3955883.1 hypothetical protein HBH53_003490 [Parastagonospora nodorum]KAH3976866.1 hypothetical protein HBH51_078100 [Parastagonospora nodorum]KAH4007571.1 hypothetical protein HBI10_005870 [Parastagonospora nodorum]